MNGDLLLSNLIPVGAQGRSFTLQVTLHHGSSRVFVSVGVQLLEKPIDRISCAVVRVDGLRVGFGILLIAFLRLRLAFVFLFLRCEV